MRSASAYGLFIQLGFPAKRNSFGSRTLSAFFNQFLSELKQDVKHVNKFEWFECLTNL